MAIPKEHMGYFIEKARNDLLPFCVLTDKFFEINKHHEIIAQKLQDFMEGKIKRLILQTPPRSGKSRLICEAIAHGMGKLQNTDIIYTGHSINLLESFSRNIRTRVDSPEYKMIFKDTIRDGNSALNQWSMTNNNQLMIYGVGGGITGKGGHRLIIDDPYATRQDAESDTIRKKVYEWYNSTFYSRRHNQDAGICLIMQRWREDDLVGEVTQLEDWEIVKIPAISEEGVSFWESRFSVEELGKIRNQIGDYFFQSQYQQDPINEGGNDFKKDSFRRVEISEIEPILNRMRIVTFVDPAISQKQEGDFTAIVTVGHDTQSNIRYLLEVKKLKETPDEIINELFFTVAKWRNKGNSYKVGVEDVQYQRMLVFAIQNKMRETDTHFVLEPIRPTGEKEARIRSILQPLYSSYSFIHVNGLNIEDYELELLKFPNGKHDDMIDSCASACSMLLSQNLNKPKAKVYSPYVPGDY